MKGLSIGVMLVMLTQSQIGMTAPRDKDECEKVKNQIRTVQAKMRNGYTAAQGIRYEERLRRLKEKRYKVCR